MLTWPLACDVGATCASFGPQTRPHLATARRWGGESGDEPVLEGEVVFRGVDGRLHSLWSTGPNTPPIGWDNLSWAVPGAPLPASDPTAFYTPWDFTHHVLYRSSNNHLHEPYWTTGTVSHVDLTTAAFNAAASDSKASAYGSAGDSN
jgi:hypothetical protein